MNFTIPKKEVQDILDDQNMYFFLKVKLILILSYNYYSIIDRFDLNSNIFLNDEMNNSILTVNKSFLSRAKSRKSRKNVIYNNDFVKTNSNYTENINSTSNFNNLNTKIENTTNTDYGYIDFSQVKNSNYNDVSKNIRKDYIENNFKNDFNVQTSKKDDKFFTNKKQINLINKSFKNNISSLRKQNYEFNENLSLNEDNRNSNKNLLNLYSNQNRNENNNVTSNDIIIDYGLNLKNISYSNIKIKKRKILNRKNLNSFNGNKDIKEKNRNFFKNESIIVPKNMFGKEKNKNRNENNIDNINPHINDFKNNPNNNHYINQINSFYSGENNQTSFRENNVNCNTYLDGHLNNFSLTNLDIDNHIKNLNNNKHIFNRTFYNSRNSDNLQKNKEFQEYFFNPNKTLIQMDICEQIKFLLKQYDFYLQLVLQNIFLTSDMNYKYRCYTILYNMYIQRTRIINYYRLPQFEIYFNFCKVSIFLK